MIVGNTTLLGISTLTSEINFYTRLMRMRDPATGLPMFMCSSIELACAKCKDEGKTTECVHLLHLVPRWQSSERHRRLKTVMQDRPDLIQSELSGLAFESLQTVFRPADINTMLTQPCPEPILNDTVYIVIDPAAGGPQSDYAIISFQRAKGLVTVRIRLNRHPPLTQRVIQTPLPHQRHHRYRTRRTRKRRPGPHEVLHGCSYNYSISQTLDQICGDDFQPRHFFYSGQNPPVDSPDG